MSKNESETLAKIHSVAEKEFLEKGFKNASLRNIVKEAGVTTGAFYGYYKCKEELFEALVSPMVEYFFQSHREIQERFNSLTPEKQRDLVEKYSEQHAVCGMKFAYENLNRMKLLLTAAGGTRHENFVHDLVEMEIESTRRFMQVMEEARLPVARLNPHFEHTITSGMYNSFFELIIHDVPYDEAMECSMEIYKFYQAGWSACMGLK